MTHTEKTLRVAVAQAAPVIMDREATVLKALDIIEKAAQREAKLLVFPEAFISAYPRGLSFGAVIGGRSMESRRDFLRYYESSVSVPGKTTDILGKAAKKAGLYLAMGVIEREDHTGTLYCTLLYFDPSGCLKARHRKLKPTGAERLVWGEGDGSTLAVLDTPYGRMGGLICWENYMPLARAAMYAKGVSLYLAPTADQRDTWQATIRHIALEGRCYVLSCNQFVTKDMYPKDLHCYNDLKSQPDIICRGGSAIISPLGQYVAEPVFDREELIVADLDLDHVIEGRFDFDPAGHYARPDVFELIVHE